jgi:hypothetical protein
MTPFIVFGLIIVAVVAYAAWKKKSEPAKPAQGIDLENLGQNPKNPEGLSVNEMRARRGLPPDPNQP